MYNVDMIATHSCVDIDNAFQFRALSFDPKLLRLYGRNSLLLVHSDGVEVRPELMEQVQHLRF